MRATGALPARLLSAGCAQIIGVAEAAEVIQAPMVLAKRRATRSSTALAFVFFGTVHCAGNVCLLRHHRGEVGTVVVQGVCGAWA